MFAGNFAPRGWSFCEGQLLPISSNTALFSILGTTYGGDGRTTFGLPDLRGQFIRGLDTDKLVDAETRILGSMQMDFRREIKLSDKPVMKTWCSAIEGKRMKVEHRIFVNDKCVVKGNTVLVGFDETTRKSCALPNHWQASPSPE